MTDMDFVLGRDEPVRQGMQAALIGAEARKRNLPRYRVERWLKNGVFKNATEAEEWYLKARTHWYGAVDDGTCLVQQHKRQAAAEAANAGPARLGESRGDREKEVETDQQAVCSRRESIITKQQQESEAVRAAGE